MQKSSPTDPWDGVAIAISGLCALHCLALPVLISVLPILTESFLEHETVHAWLLVLIIPVSGWALGRGYRRHRDAVIWPPALLGILLLVLAAVAGIPLLGEWLERAVTVSGGLVLAWSHWLNYRRLLTPPSRA